MVSRNGGDVRDFTRWILTVFQGRKRKESIPITLRSMRSFILDCREMGLKISGCSACETAAKVLKRCPVCYSPLVPPKAANDDPRGAA